MAAKGYLKASAVVSMFAATIVTSFVYCFRNYIIDGFTVSPEIRANTKAIFLLGCIKWMPEIFAGFLLGPIKALGEQRKIVPVNVVVLVTNVSLGWFLGFYMGLGYPGIIFAGLVSQIFFVGAMLRIIWHADWAMAPNLS